MPFWKDHQMAIVVWKFVHHHARVFASIDNEVLLILLLHRFLTENTRFLLII
jgi:hypothetical protein